MVTGVRFRVSGKYSQCTDNLYETTKVSWWSDWSLFRPEAVLVWNSAWPEQQTEWTSNIQHRTSNIVTLRFIYFKTSEPQNIKYRTAECRREEEKRISNIECRIMNVEGRNSVYFIKKDRAQRYHPSKFCGSLFCGSAVRFSLLLLSWDHVFSVICCLISPPVTRWPKNIVQ